MFCSKADETPFFGVLSNPGHVLLDLLLPAGPAHEWVTGYSSTQASILGLRGRNPQILGWGLRGLHKMLLYLIMHWNMRWEHFPKWWLY